MNKSKRLSLVILSMILLSNCQNKKATYFQDYKTREFLSEDQYKNLKAKKIKQSQELKNLILRDTILETKLNRDSIIKIYELSVSFDIKGVENRKLENQNQKIGTKIQFENLTTVDGKSINSASLIGKPTLINTWFTLCKPCVEEIPILNKLANDYSDEMNFITLTFNDRDKVSSFLEETDFNFIHIVDAKQTLQSLGVNSYPQNIILDKNGVIRHFENGIKYKTVDGENVIGDGGELIPLIENLIARN